MAEFRGVAELEIPIATVLQRASYFDNLASAKGFWARQFGEFYPKPVRRGRPRSSVTKRRFRLRRRAVMTHEHAGSSEHDEACITNFNRPLSYACRRSRFFLTPDQEYPLYDQLYETRCEISVAWRLRTSRLYRYIGELRYRSPKQLWHGGATARCEAPAGSRCILIVITLSFQGTLGQQ